MALCTTYKFTCPIDGGGGGIIGGETTSNCSWNVVCCDGTKLVYELGANKTEELCVLEGTTPIKNSLRGSINPAATACTTNCGDADNTPLAGYEYKEYENCTDATQKQIFRAPSGYASWPIVAWYNSICWQNGTITSTTSGINVASLTPYADCATCAAVPSPPTPPVPPTPSTTPEYCLIQSNETTVVASEEVSVFGMVIVPAVDPLYLFNGNLGVFKVQLGQYFLLNVPSAHPIAILNNGLEHLISYTGQYTEKSAVANDGNTYTFYYGTITINVNGDFGVVSYQSLFGGYLGGENNLQYDATCPSPTTPTPVSPTPTPAPTSVVPPIPSPVKTDWTLSYSNNAQGWPSFYSFNPDYMIGMNNYFYTFKGGNLYQHNTNELRNNYYGVQYNSQISSVFNESPLQNKVFKTLNLESDNAWEAYMETDIQNNGIIEDGWFEKKEGAYFSYVRQEGEIPALTGEYANRSANGIGKAANVSVDAGTTTLSFSTNPLVSIGGALSVGDYIYHSTPSYTVLNFGGIVTNIEIDLPNSINKIYVTTNETGAVAFPADEPYIMFIKSSEAESHGLLGHYCLFTVTNFNTNKTELFAVESDIMKSYP